MHANDQKARFSLADINAVAACTGFDAREPKVDIDSVGDACVTFPQPAKNDDDLRMDVIVPRLLIRSCCLSARKIG